MPTNQFVPVATGAGANVRPFSQWAGTAVQVTGVQTGIVASRDMNTAWRQGTTMASVLGQMIVNRVNIDATDDGNVPGLLANVERGVAAMLDSARYAIDGGQINTLVASVSPAPVALGQFAQVRVRVAFTNTSTTPTLNINGFGPLTIVRQDGSALAAGDLQANRIAHFVYDNVANAWRLGGPAASDLLGASYITGAVTKTVGGTNPDFANLQAAFAWLSNYRITQTGSVTFQLAAGQFIYNTSVSFYHPDGARVSVLGATLKAAQTTGGALAYTGNSASARANDKASNLGLLRAVYATEIAFQGAAGFFGYGYLGNMQDILISSDGTSTSTDCCLWNFGSLTLTRMAFVGGGYRGFASYAGFVNILGTAYGLGCGVNGFAFYSASSGVLGANAVLVGSGNGSFGIAVSSSTASSTQSIGATLYSRGNGSDGIRADSGQIYASSSSVSANNAGSGYWANANSTMSLVGSTALNNGVAGYAAQGNSFMDATSTSGGGNGTVGYYAYLGSSLLRPSGTASGTNGAASPAVGTNGNANSLIS